MPQKVSPRKMRAIELLTSGKNVTQVARAIGVNRRTVTRWALEPAFTEALRQARHRAFEGALGRLEAGFAEAVDVTRKALKATKPLPKDRLHAAGMLLRTGLTAHDQLDIEERLQALERTRS